MRGGTRNGTSPWKIEVCHSIFFPDVENKNVNASFLTTAPQSWEGSRGQLNIHSYPTPLSQGTRTNKQKNCNIHSCIVTGLQIQHLGVFSVITTFHVFGFVRPKNTSLRGFYLIVKYSGEAVNIVLCITVLAWGFHLLLAPFYPRRQ